mgnify:FL=1
MKSPNIKHFEVSERFSLKGKKLSAIELNGALLDGQYIANAEILSENSAYTVLSKYSGTEVKGFLGFGTRHHFHVVVYDHFNESFSISKESYKALTVISMIDGIVHLYKAFNFENKKNAVQLPFTEDYFDSYEAYDTGDDSENAAYMSFENLGVIDSDHEGMHALGAGYIGSVIERVWYALPNYPDGNNLFDKFHLADMAVLIEFSNGKRLNWLWLEETMAYHISTKDIWTILDKNFTDCLEEVSGSPGWQQLIGNKVINISFLFNDNIPPERLSDLRIETETGMAQICATEEPVLNELSELDELPVSNDWTVVVFDDDLLKLHNRHG